MDVADKIGLLPGFGWFAGWHPVLIFLTCWAITPLGHNLVGWIGESRWVPWTADKQFQSFFPGDLFLGTTAALLLIIARRLPNEERWYNSTTLHVIVLVGALAVAAFMTYGEWKSGAYPTRAIFSPTKLYHNGVLYVGYGYIIVTTLIAVIAGSAWGSFSWLWVWHVVIMILVLLPALVWVRWVIIDSTLSKTNPELQRQKTASAHIEDWQPIWSSRK